MDALLSVDDLAKFLKCPKKTIYDKAARGYVPKPLKIGQLLRWRREDIEKWLEDKKKEEKKKRLA